MSKKETKKDSEPTKAKQKTKIILVKLLKGQQFQCPETKVILKIGEMIPVPKVSNWMEFQETVGLLEIIE